MVGMAAALYPRRVRVFLVSPLRASHPFHVVYAQRAPLTRGIDARISVPSGVDAGTFGYVALLPAARAAGLSSGGGIRSARGEPHQFWLHSTLIPRLGPLEWIFNTPSAHRVHHASNDEYIDKNFGGILILFDRLFGTYKAENPAVTLRYGLACPITTNNPLKIVYGDFIAMFRDVWSAKPWGDRWSMMFKPPGWIPEPVKLN